MEIRTVEKPAFRVVGLRYVGKNENQEIPTMWGQFMERMPEIEGRSGPPSDFYGVCSMPEGLEPGAFEYIAAVEVSSDAPVPGGLVDRLIPAQTYAVFRAATLSEIMGVYQKAYEQWLPQGGYTPGGEVDFEYYDETFDPDAGGPVWVYIPVRTIK